MEWQDNGLSDGRGDLFDETLGQSMRWWATETSDGRLLLRRSVVIRCCALVALVVGGARHDLQRSAADEPLHHRA